tara:strand:+ start:33 stop:371 length:339 start_codon:yes stop_codon:yes gene_type:complete
MARRTVKTTTRTRRNLLTGRTRVTTKTKGAGRRKSKDVTVYNRDGSVRKSKTRTAATATQKRGRVKTVTKKGNTKTIVRGQKPKKRTMRALAMAGGSTRSRRARARGGRTRR